jgi:predicted AAA+ superfamily ATPase
LSCIFLLSLLDSKFIHTTLFGELREEYLFYRVGSSCRLICLLGPKGLGKTTSMKQLMRADDVYIDLLRYYGVKGL